jgi:hypothetical protein
VVILEELEEVVVVVFLEELDEVVVVVFFEELDEVVVVVGAARATERMMLKMSTTDSIVRWAKIILKMNWSENAYE